MGRNWPEPCAAQTEISPEHHTGATHSGRSPHISPKAPPSTSVKAPCWSPAGSRRLERGSGYGLRPGEGVCIAFFSQTSSLDPLPSGDKPKQRARVTSASRARWRAATAPRGLQQVSLRRRVPRPQGKKTLWAGKPWG